MHPFKTTMVKDLLVTFGAFVALAVAWLLACTPAQLTQVQDASNKRQVICDFVSVWAPGEPQLKRIDELCKAGENLKAIAAAYAECPAPKAEQ